MSDKVQLAPIGEPHLIMRGARGFSMIELLIVTIIIMIMGGVSFITLQPMLKQARVTNAYNTTLMALRLARENAVTQKGAYRVSFNSPTANSITVAPLTAAMAACGGATAGAQWAGASTFTYSLPSDVGFRIVPGVPTAPTATPDGFGVAAFAIDFDQGIGAGGATSVVFCPDGSAQDTVGNLNNGVVYMARASELYSSRAITLWGSTGRLRGWRLLQNGSCGSNCWSQQ